MAPASRPTCRYCSRVNRRPEAASHVTYSACDASGRAPASSPARVDDPAVASAMRSSTSPSSTSTPATRAGSTTTRRRSSVLSGPTSTWVAASHAASSGTWTAASKKSARSATTTTVPSSCSRPRPATTAVTWSCATSAVNSSSNWSTTSTPPCARSAGSGTTPVGSVPGVTTVTGRPSAARRAWTPARSSDDLPEPDEPTTTTGVPGAEDSRPTRWSVAASRPKNRAESSAW